MTFRKKPSSLISDIFYDLLPVFLVLALLLLYPGFYVLMLLALFALCCYSFKTAMLDWHAHQIRLIVDADGIGLDGPPIFAYGWLHWRDVVEYDFDVEPQWFRPKQYNIYIGTDDKMLLVFDISTLSAADQDLAIEMIEERVLHFGQKRIDAGEDLVIVEIDQEE